MPVNVGVLPATATYTDTFLMVDKEASQSMPPPLRTVTTSPVPDVAHIGTVIVDFETCVFVLQRQSVAPNRMLAVPPQLI